MGIQAPNATAKPAGAARPSRLAAWKHRLENWRWNFSTPRFLLYLAFGAAAWSVFAFGGVYFWVFIPAYALLDIGLLLWAVQLSRGRQRLRPDPLLLPILAVLAWITIQWLWISPVPGRTLTALLHGLGAAAIYFLVSQNYQARVDNVWMSRRLAILCGALAWLGLVEWGSGSNGIYWHFHYLLAKPFGPFVNRDNFAACMDMLLPGSVLQAWHARSRPDRALLWALIPAVGVADVVLSRSLSGLLVLIVEAIWTLWLVQRWRRRKPDASGAAGSRAPGAASSSGKSPWLVAGFCLLLFVIVSFSGLAPQTLRVMHLQSQASTQQRIALDHSTLALWRQHPWTGWGLGTWQPVYYRYNHLYLNAVIEYAHDDWLQWLAETGLIGSLLALLGLGLFASRLTSLSHASRWGEKLRWMAAMGIASVLLTSLVQFNLHIPAILLLAGLLSGTAAAPIIPRRSDTEGVH